MEKLKNLFLLMFLVFIGIQLQAQEQEPIWLSNQPPKKIAKKFKTAGMHRYCAFRQKGDDERGRNRHGTWGEDTDYVQWVRKGGSIEKAKYFVPSDQYDIKVAMKDPLQKDAKIELIKEKDYSYLKFNLGQEGRYNAYLILSKPENNDTLVINIAKAELYSHSCRNGHSKKIINRPVKFYPDITDFEIIRIRKSDESLHHYTRAGDSETYQVLYKGKPAPDVSVKVYTQKGWVKTLKTDKEGKVKVDFIQDYFSKLQEFNRRKTYYFMVQADLISNDSIQYKGKTYHNIHYITTVSDGYRPWRLMYKSKVWGLIIFLSIMIITGVGVFIYRERRKKPYKEITFEENKTN